MKYIWWWLEDIFYGLKTLIHSQIYRAYHPAFNKSSPGKNAVIVIPGIWQTWNVFRDVINFLSEKGYSVYTVKGLKRNLVSVEQAAQLVRKTIEQNNLADVTLIAHSKGGLVGKYYLAFLNQNNKVKKLIALSTPFNGSTLAKSFPVDFHKEIIPDSRLLQTLSFHKEVNNKIVSIYPKWDNKIKPLESCVLPGAKNIQVRAYGHQKILFRNETEQVILNELK